MFAKIFDRIQDSGLILNKPKSCSISKAITQIAAAVDRNSTVVEIPIHSPADAEDLRKIKASCPEAFFGAGSLSTLGNMKDAWYAGADFFLSSHTNTEMIDFAKEKDLFYISGGATPSELAQLALHNPLLQHWYTGKNIAAYQLQDLLSELPQLSLMLTVRAESYEGCLEKSEKLKAAGAKVIRMELA